MFFVIILGPEDQGLLHAPKPINSQSQEGRLKSRIVYSSGLSIDRFNFTDII